MSVQNRGNSAIARLEASYRPFPIELFIKPAKAHCLLCTQSSHGRKISFASVPPPTSRPATSRASRWGDERVAVYNIDGTFYATEAQCTHAAADLGDGNSRRRRHRMQPAFRRVSRAERQGRATALLHRSQDVSATEVKDGQGLCGLVGAGSDRFLRSCRSGARADATHEPLWLRVRAGGPISTGWKSTARRHGGDERQRPSTCPCLEVPGWLDSHKLPNAVAVVSALNITARVRLDWQKPGLAGSPRHDCNRS